VWLCSAQLVFFYFKYSLHPCGGGGGGVLVFSCDKELKKWVCQFPSLSVSLSVYNPFQQMTSKDVIKVQYAQTRLGWCQED
jgi:hypothetical protein